MSLVISSGKNKTTSRPSATTGRGGSGSRSCGCGQQLDICAHAHCPRCGRTLRRG
jgi:hypothetical protein